MFASIARILTSVTLYIANGYIWMLSPDSRRCQIQFSLSESARKRFRVFLRARSHVGCAAEDAHCLRNLRDRIKDAILSDGFVRSYLETALWSSHAFRHENDNETFDSAGYEVEDISFDSVLSQAFDCLDFQDTNLDRLEISDHGTDRDGHDFWLSRNGHGAGFFDRFDGSSDELQESARHHGTVDLYLGDDEQIHDSDVLDPRNAAEVISRLASDV